MKRKQKERGVGWDFTVVGRRLGKGKKKKSAAAKRHKTFIGVKKYSWKREKRKKYF